MNSEPAAKPAKSAPAYQRIEEDIRAKVRDGRLPAGTMLAGRHALAREYGVALSTAQQAVARLLADGVLETSDRRGTFVAHGRGLGAASAARLAGATLGIVATSRIEPAASPDVGSLWARLAIRSLEQVFSASGGTTHFFERYPDERGPYPRGLDDANAYTVTEAIHSLRADGAEAIAIIGLCDAKDLSDEVVSAVDVEQVPAVYISWHELSPPLAQVFYDNRFAGYQAARHLLSQGYRSLAFVAPFADLWLLERIGGARDAVRQAGLPSDTLRLYPGGTPAGDYDRHVAAQTVYHAASALFADLAAAGVSPAGIISPNDEMAYAVRDAASERGLTMGAGFGLIGFDDDVRSCAAGLTTVRPPVEAMGEEAGRLLLRALRGDKQGVQVRVRSQVIPRASTVRLPKAAVEGRT